MSKPEALNKLYWTEALTHSPAAVVGDGVSPHAAGVGPSLLVLPM